MVSWLFYLLSLMIVKQWYFFWKEEEMYSQLDMTVKFHGVGAVEFLRGAQVTLLGAAIGFVPVLRVIMGIWYLNLVGSQKCIPTSNRLVIDKIIKI